MNTGTVKFYNDQRGFGFPRTTAGAVDMGAFQHPLADRIFTFGFEAEP